MYRYRESEQSKCVYVCVINVHDSCLNPQGDNSWDSTTNTYSLTYPSLHISLTISKSLHPQPHLFHKLVFTFISRNDKEFSFCVDCGRKRWCFPEWRLLFPWAPLPLVINILMLVCTFVLKAGERNTQHISNTIFLFHTTVFCLSRPGWTATVAQH